VSAPLPPFASGASADWAVTAAARLARPELPLPEGTAFVGDLHLDLDDPAALLDFEGFWAARQPGERWVFLGDLFEYWVGAAHERFPAGQRALRALRGASQRGVGLDLVVGNRDFLCGQRFAALAGMRVHPAGFRARFPDGSLCLVLHGDELCSRDIGYQRLKRVLRSPALLWVSEQAPGWFGRAVAKRLRGASRTALAHKPAPLAEQQAAAALYLCRSAGAAALVCGHAHRFRREELAPGCTWWVVDALGGPRDLLRRTPRGFEPEASGYPGRG
jgi:UDP-2,3-diacylglucosamine hydrolase